MYADDTNLLVPRHSDIQMKGEFDALPLRASKNKMVVYIHFGTTKENVFRRSKPRLNRPIDNYIIPIHRIEQVTESWSLF